MPNRKFFDLYITYSPDNVREMILLTKHLGYSGVCIEVDPQHFGDSENLELEINRIKKFANNIGVDVFFRTDSSVKHDTLKKLAGLIRILSINVTSDTEFRVALRNKFANVISCDMKTCCQILSPELINLLHQFRGKYVEMRLSHFLKLSPIEKGLILSQFYRRKNLFNKEKFPLIISSGAQKPSELMSPRCVRSFLRLIGFTEKKILEALSENPAKLINLPWDVILLEQGD